MVVIKIELWPLGFEENKQQLGEMYIANDCSGTQTRGNYKVKVFGKKKQLAEGEIKDFPRKQQDGWDLLFRALLATRGKKHLDYMVELIKDKLANE